ncbi:A24 family peptidase [Roseibium limicola]|uniref:Prepilin peptidase n=1 Tax=Roseibium limicola TaxID=2816037 RepID=A0A939ENL9_9HYPH|nr:prepilin peptidase [Roseibium limicola]MBO0345688.1 prepilin peptidase [Roseibium limicola]
MIVFGILTIFPALVALAAVSDLLTMKIPNWLNLLLVAGFIIAAAFAGLSLAEWGLHGLACAVVFVVCFTMFVLGWMGGGDAKLASAIALWLGWTPVLLAFAFWTAVYGAVLTAFILIFRRAIPVLPGPFGRMGWLLRLHDQKTGIPYGIALAAAALQVFPRSVWFALLGSG